MASFYKMKCPSCGRTVFSGKARGVCRTENSSPEKTYIFKCDKCNKMFMPLSWCRTNMELYNANHEGLPLYKTNVSYVEATKEEEKKIWNQMHPSPVAKGSSKTDGKGNGGAKGLEGNQWKAAANQPDEKVARIQVIQDKDLDPKLKANVASLKKSHPKVMPEQMRFQELVTKVFPGQLKQQIVARNESFLTDKGFILHRVRIYSTSSSYLSKRLPENTYLSFGGKIIKGELIIDEMHILEHPVMKEDDVATEMTFLYDGPNHYSWFYSITENEAEHAQKLTGEIASWSEYLDWKRQLAELRIRGLKYIGFKFNVEEQEMTFLSIADGKECFNEFRRFLRRNEVSIFSNNYSNDRWSFEFNREYQDWKNNDSGVALSFVRVGRQYPLREIEAYEWDGVREHAKRYERENSANTRFLTSGINRSYSEPIAAELIFELSPNAHSTISRQLRRNGSIDEDIEETLAEEFYGDGYIATSQIGDFALLRRLKSGVNDLVIGRAASHGLDQWLFDIKKARVPEKIEPITVWQNESINDKQKQAVEKILSVPDVCLIQGPPGTGKTTVIAEAIYQFVIRNKRVLVASQANLAVDNALERLISNPKIRAIRLGSAKKIDSSVSNITEGNVLETFYNSIVNYIDESFVSKWNTLDAYIQGGERDYERFQSIHEEIEKLQGQISDKEVEIAQLSASWNADEEYMAQNLLRTEKIALVLLKSYCQGLTDELELVLNKEAVVFIWAAMEPVLKALQKEGLWLTRVGIDVENLESSERILRANDNLKYILVNGKNAMRLLTKLQASEEFGGNLQELEELKIQETLLTNKMLENPTHEIIVQWQTIKKKITEFNASGMGLSDTEKKLFDEVLLSIMTDEQKKEHMISVLNRALPIIQLLLQNVETSVQELCDSITAKQKAFDEKSTSNELRKEQLKTEISEIQQDIQTQQRNREKILRKYKATPETLRQQIDIFINQAKLKYQTSIARDDWEDIFRGLENWVEKIPDYRQEKDIYLKDFINGCNVVGVSCTENTRTLTENGFDDFDVVIIDEVSKATPPELLIPMLRGRKIVLVGDHRQLPPLFNEHEKTYLEVAEQQEGMDDIIAPLTMADFNKYKDMVTASLFERYFENAGDMIKETLIKQYRMHTDIMDIINIFYDGYLRDGNEDQYTFDTKAHYLSIPSTSGTEMIIPERHAYWFDSSVLGGEKIYEQRRAGSSSAENLVEAEMILELLKKMERQYANQPDRKEPVSVGVISFYFDQVALIRRMLREESFHAIDVEVNTVDRFQGKEKEIIFVSLVRNVKNFHHNVDSHIAAFQRINVAFSRAQNLLVIVGAKDMYANQPVRLTDMNNGEEKTIMAYKQIIEMLDQRGTYFTSDEVITDVRADEILRRLKQNQGGDE